MAIPQSRNPTFQPLFVGFPRSLSRSLGMTAKMQTSLISIYLGVEGGRRPHPIDITPHSSLLTPHCYVVTFVKRESAIYIITILFFREHLKRVLEKQSSALATLLFVDWLPQVNGPPKSPVSLKS